VNPRESQPLSGLVLDSLPGQDLFESNEIPAPVLVLPRLFEPDFCDQLVNLYEEGQSHDSGFMRNKSRFLIIHSNGVATISSATSRLRRSFKDGFPCV